MRILLAAAVQRVSAESADRAACLWPDEACSRTTLQQESEDIEGLIVMAFAQMVPMLMLLHVHPSSLP